MAERPNLDEDKGGKLIDPTRFRGMVGSLMYLSASRPDIVFAVCMCARYQAKPTEKHLTAIKRASIPKKRNHSHGFVVSEGLRFELKAFADADYADCQRHTRKSRIHPLLTMLCSNSLDAFSTARLWICVNIIPMYCGQSKCYALCVIVSTLAFQAHCFTERALRDTSSPAGVKQVTKTNLKRTPG
ncbi:hypothetical protein Tco_0966815 [Tanacetum coccineum]